jgi:omega-amidase
MKDFKIAVCQNKPSRDKALSIKKVTEMIDNAVINNAKLILLPEIFYHPYELSKIPKIEENNNETLNKLKEVAKDKKIFLCTGTMVQKEGNKRFNKSFLLSPKGEVLLKYSKSHLFDVSFKSLRTKESRVFTYGEDLSVIKTDLGTIGIIICYDIRFPEMARKLALMGAEIILIPAAFNTITGPLHWEILLRARAIENQVYIAAASPARDNKSTYQAYGHSMIIDPMGKILSEADITEKIIYADCKNELLTETRSRIPVLKHRRPDIYYI